MTDLQDAQTRARLTEISEALYDIGQNGRCKVTRPNGDVLHGVAWPSPVGWLFIGDSKESISEWFLAANGWEVEKDG